MGQFRGPGRRFVPPGGKGAANPRKTIKRIFSYMEGRFRLYMGIVILCHIITSIAGVLSSLFLRVLVDDHIIPLTQMAVPEYSGLLRAILMMAGIYLLSIATSYLSQRLMANIAQGMQRNIRDDMFIHLQTLPLSYFDTHAAGDVMSHFTNDVDTLRQMLSQSVPQLLSSSLVIVFTFFAMLFTSPILTGILLAVLSLTMTIARKVASQSGRYFREQQAATGKINGYIEEMTNGQKVIKVFCHEEVAKQQFDQLNTILRDAAAKANGYANIMMPLMAQMGNVQYAILASVGGLMAVAGVGGLTLGGIISFLQLSRSLTQPLNQVSSQFNSIVMALAGSDRIFSLLDQKSEVDEGNVRLIYADQNSATGEWTEAEKGAPGACPVWAVPQEDGTVTYTALAGDVRLLNVDFGYIPDKPVLHEITLYAKPGQKVAFVGATGAGKTTISNLLNRFYDVSEGKVLYDGIDVRDIRKADLRRALGIVLQDTHLFTGTILDNIRYGRLNATDEEIYAAAKLANAHDFIARLPNGYDTMLTDDGADLSQGQRQLLAIARAAVADPPVMILDEATSSIDTRTELLVQRGMDSLMQGRTVFVIAHRLSTIRNSNVIIVLDFGQIIERGNHAELMELGQRYYGLYLGGMELE